MTGHWRHRRRRRWWSQQAAAVVAGAAAVTAPTPTTDEPAPAPAPVTAPAPAPVTGTGGPFTAQQFQSFTGAGQTSRYHLYANGVDPAKEVGLLLWMDGSGGYGFDNPNREYLIDADGAAGMRDVAADHNMLLLVPEAPAPNCDGEDNCWYNTTGTPNARAKADWLRALVDNVYTRYPVVKDRVAVGGYSSGAQATTRYFLPEHGPAIQTDGVFVPVAYGGAPDNTVTFTPAYKAAVHGHWDTGTADSAYTTASWGARGGHAWYTNQGFTTTANWPAGVGHNRGGQFDDIMRAQINAHVRVAGPVTPTG